MKTTKRFVPVLLLLTALMLSACQFNVTQGSGRVITEKRQVSGFNAVSFSGMGDLTLSQGNQETLTIEAEDNIMPHIITEVRGGTLYISQDQSARQNWIQPSRPIRFNLAVKNIHSFDLSGAGTIQSASLKADSLSLNVSGAGNIKLDHVEVSDLTSGISGAGDIDIAGKAARQDIHMSGIGNYRTGSLQAQSATVEISGAGNATLWVKDSLSANISGAGSIDYYGNPQVRKTISGVGSVKSLGDKQGE
jgi:predicted small secreted protein